MTCKELSRRYRAPLCATISMACLDFSSFRQEFDLKKRGFSREKPEIQGKKDGEFDQSSMDSIDLEDELT